ncbi:MAG TPA: MATE family efflux transporter [Polyangia bacterium]|nr:MATE family efflux transporter [Polyangia bacterium]
MEESRKKLSWSEAPFAELLRLSWPITVSTISYSVMTLVDTLLVGHLGAAQLAGVGLGGTVAFALLCFAIGLLRGAKTVVAQAVGAGQREEVGAYLGAALACAGAIGAITVGAGQLTARLLPLISATPDAGDFARTYLSIRSLGAPLALAYVALREVRYGESEARLPMVATVIANLVNIALACTFVYALHWGVAGAAWATVIAHSVEAGVLALAQKRRGWGVSRMRARHLRALWRVGMPTAIQFTLEVGSFAMLAAMVAAMSEVDMAAHQVALQVVHFSFLPAFAVAEAASVLTGQAVGADRDALVLTVARQAMAIVAGYTGACTLVLALGAPLIVSGFTADPALLAAAVRLLHVAAVFNMFDGANIVARATLRGTGDVRYPAVVGVVTSWALTPPLTWWLGYRLHLRAFGGWLGLCAEIILGALILWWRVERRGWASAARSSRSELQLPARVTA